MYVLLGIYGKQKIKHNLGNFLKSFVVIDSKWALSFRIAAKNKKEMKMYAGMCLYTSVGKGGIDSIYYWRCYQAMHTRVERPDWVTLDLIKRR